MLLWLLLVSIVKVYMKDAVPCIMVQEYERLRVSLQVNAALVLKDDRLCVICVHLQLHVD